MRNISIQATFESSSASQRSPPESATQRSQPFMVRIGSGRAGRVQQLQGSRPLTLTDLVSINTGLPGSPVVESQRIFKGGT